MTNTPIMTMRFDRLQAFLCGDRMPLPGFPPTTSEAVDARRSYGARNYLSEDQGSGYWDWLRVSEDLLISVTDATYRADTWIGLLPDRCFKVRILLAGTLLDEARAPLLRGPSGCMQLLGGTSEAGYFIQAGQRARMVVLHVRPGLLTSRFGVGADAPYDMLGAIFDEQINNVEIKRIGLSHGALQAARDMLESRDGFSPELRRRYIEAKATEILCAALQMLQAGTATDACGRRYNGRDLIRLCEARDLIAENYACPPTIERLSRMVAINQTKLKAGFRLIFGETIFDYVQRCRMERAIQLLTSSAASISEIAHSVGYDYPANFTNAFKRHFGYLPSALRQSPPH